VIYGHQVKTKELGMQLGWRRLKTYTEFGGETSSKCTLGRPGGRWEDYINMDVTDAGSEDAR
jgi:hypothetical protein